jgi:hypothetical protein
MANKWLVHIKSTMKTMKRKGTYKKGMGLKQVIMEAKKTWKKHRGGGTDGEGVSEEDTPMSPPEGGRRKTRRRRHSRRR